MCENKKSTDPTWRPGGISVRQPQCRKEGGGRYCHLIGLIA